ncbi:MAG: pirin family protein [Alphaproteobacteria bacterium]|nr:MAG: pirin family protein [Alphaproteobacteria bacterium]
MITVRRSEDRGHANHGWLQSQHTFSFASYFDPNHMGFGPLRVINEDRVQGGQGFPTHGHRDMEIISYVIDGALEHKDTLGTGSVIVPGDVQRMSAGSGIRHSEYNHSPADTVHFLQIWIIPAKEGIRPSYEQKRFTAEEKTGQWRLVGSPDGRDGSVTIHQDVNLYAALVKSGDSIEHHTRPDRNLWVQVVRGGVSVNGKRLKAGDGAAIEDEDLIELVASTDSEVLLFDMTSRF